MFPLIALANMVTPCETWNQPINHIYFVSIVFWTYLKYWIKETSYLFFYRKYSFFLLKKVLYWNSSDIQIAKAFATTQNLKERQCYINEPGRHAAIQMKVWKSKFYAAHDIIINVDNIIEIEYNNKALI